MDQPNHPSSLAALLQELRDDTMTLLRQEIALAKAELSEKSSRLGRNVGQLATGGFLAFAGLIVLLFGLSELLVFGLVRGGVDADLAQWIGPLVVGVIVALIGWGVFAKAKRTLNADGLVPEQTLATLRENKQWAQSKIHQASHEPAV